jgi:phosphatidylglycerophosphate synthase
MSEQQYESNNQSKNGRKVDSSIENPIDNFMIETSEILSPYFKSMNYTPNGITTISFIFGIAALYHLYYHDVYKFGVYFALSHLFDCLDGYYSRKYDMVTDIGDKYDHFTDLFVAISMVYIICSRYNVTDFPILIIVICLMTILGMMSVGCHEKITHADNKSGTLQIFDCISPEREACLTYTNYLKYFGAGTLVFAVIAAVIYMDMYENNETNNYNNNGISKLSVNSDNNMRYILDIARPFNGFGSVSTNPFL